VPRTLRKAARIVGVESLQWDVFPGLCDICVLKLQITDVFQFYVAGGFKQSRSGILVSPWSQEYQLDQDS